ncbi:hypothetical protein PENTCL1PPCAC_18871, partial [Pristionchus entomophagus]
MGYSFRYRAIAKRANVILNEVPISELSQLRMVSQSFRTQVDEFALLQPSIQLCKKLTIRGPARHCYTSNVLITMWITEKDSKLFNL